MRQRTLESTMNLVRVAREPSADTGTILAGERGTLRKFHCMETRVRRQGALLMVM